MELCEKYKEELELLKEKMLSAQKFAEKFPYFSEMILFHKHPEDFRGNLSNSYKNLYLAWGINRYFASKQEHITNYKGDITPQFIWNIYVNEYSLFNEYTESGIEDVKNKTEVFFFDHLNTTFYVTDDQLMPFLEKLNEWYENAKIINSEYKKELKRQELLKQLDELND